MSALVSARREALANVSIGDMTRRHAERIAARAPDRSVQEQTLNGALALHLEEMRWMRDLFRSRGWTVATPDPTRDRFSLRGAFVLGRLSKRAFAKRRVAATDVKSPSVDCGRLRVEADLAAVLRLANPPEPLPGTPWPLFTLIARTAMASFIVMSAMWDGSTAALILAVLLVHEAGHAIAMRLSGYRDVHVFFVPLLGALTIGHPAAVSVRGRLGVLFAGPVPGLCLAVLLLLIADRWTDSAYDLRTPAFALLILNGLNLLPFTPLGPNPRDAQSPGECLAACAPRPERGSAHRDGTHVARSDLHDSRSLLGASHPQTIRCVAPAARRRGARHPPL